ncbi:MAG: nucleoside 2-deoxyribosyltransferase [Mailhella sp.]|nr:nucleoside 2-deoxyribosyltransferase [Mailhella sp.]
METLYFSQYLNIVSGYFHAPCDLERRSATGEKVTAKQIMEADRDALLSCDVVVALLDGAQVDDGTAWEIGSQKPERGKIPQLHAGCAMVSMTFLSTT